MRSVIVALGINDHHRISKARNMVYGNPSEPYLSLAVFDDTEASKIEAGCEILAAKLARTTISVSGLGIFQGDAPVIFASVTLTENLRVLHTSVHKTFPQLLSRPYYQPGAWDPHITLAMCDTISAAESKLSSLLPFSLRGTYTGSELLLVSAPPVCIEKRFDLRDRT
ncbi:MAG: 2'-5' RNA ligase family protein [Pseudomonadales bacterium]|nr:2'-5' RNA ligase family protein [Pseudomonadales bacterium]